MAGQFAPRSRAMSVTCCREDTTSEKCLFSLKKLLRCRCRMSDCGTGGTTKSKNTSLANHVTSDVQYRKSITVVLVNNIQPDSFHLPQAIIRF